MDATGASPDCSIIGNTIERGFGHTPMGDHCANACGFEVVLPTASASRRASAGSRRARTGALSRWGVGPSLDGLFSQSNLGIVTRMSVWLMPAPEALPGVLLHVQGRGGLAAVVDALRPLRLNGTLRSVMHIGNDYKVLAAAGQFPWDQRPHAARCGREEAKRRRQKLDIGSWNGSGGLYGTRVQVREARADAARPRGQSGSPAVRRRPAAAADGAVRQAVSG